MRAVVLLRRPADLALVPAAAALGEVTALAALPDDDHGRALLAAAHAAGARRLVRLWEPALAAADYLGVAWALAAAVRAALSDLANVPTVIVAGDRDRGAVGPAVAERLSVPLLGQVLSVATRDGKVLARRRAGGLVRTYVAAPPALVCLLLEGAPLLPAGTAPLLPAGTAPPLPAGTAPPLPAGTATPLRAGTATPALVVESWSLSRVGMSAAELGHRRHFAPTPAPGPIARPLRLADAAALAARLRADGLWPPDERG